MRSAEEPEGGPDAAGTGHVGDVGDDEGVVVGLDRLEADAGSALGGDVGVVDADVDWAGVGDGGVAVGDCVWEIACERCGVGGFFGDKHDVAVGWVRAGEECEAFEEVSAA